MTGKMKKTFYIYRWINVQYFTFKEICVVNLGFGGTKKYFLN